MPKKAAPKTRRVQVVLSLTYPADLTAVRAVELLNMVIIAGERAAAPQSWENPDAAAAGRIKTGKPRIYHKPTVINGQVVKP